MLSGKLLKRKHYIINTWDYHWDKAFFWFWFFKTFLTSGSIKLTIKPFNLHATKVLFYFEDVQHQKQSVFKKANRKANILLKLFCYMSSLILLFHMHVLDHPSQLEFRLSGGIIA